MTESTNEEAPNETQLGASSVKRAWSDEDFRLIEERAAQFKTYGEIAEELGVSTGAVTQAVKRNNLAVPDRRDKLRAQKLAESSERGWLCKCGETDPEKFYEGVKSKCKACKIAYQSEYQKTEGWKAVNTRAQLKFKYKMTPEQYEERLAAQGGVCKICKKPSTNKRKTGVVFRLAIDHDHNCCPGNKTCGECTKGLLCLSCNNKIEWHRKYADSIHAYEENPYAALHVS